MFEFLIYMAVPTLAAALILYFLQIRRFGLQARLKKLLPFILIFASIFYLFSESGVCVLRPWVFDMSKSIGAGICGLPIENLLFSYIITIDISMTTLVGMEIEGRSRGWKEFIKYFFLIKNPK